MFIQMVIFTSKLSDENVIAVANERADQFRAVPGLIQKHYLQLADGRWSGFYMWNSKEDMLAFRETELAKTIPLAYEIDGAPEIILGQHIFALREQEQAA